MFSVVFLLLTFLIPALASLTPTTTTQSTLLSFGSAHTTHTYLLSTSSDTITAVTVDTPTKTPQQILTRYETRHNQIDTGVYNITVHLFFESWVGAFDYAIVVATANGPHSQTYTHVDTHAVYGMLFFEPGKKHILSGDEHAGINFPHYLSPGSEGQHLQVMTHAPHGVDMTPTLTARNTLTPGSALLPSGAVSLSDGTLHVRPADYTTGAGAIDVLCPGLVVDGEVFETVVEVSVSDNPPAPVVLVRANGTVVDGQARVEAVLKNAGSAVALLLDGALLSGQAGGGGYRFVGDAKPGVYESVGIRNAHGEGVVLDGLVLELRAGEIGANGGNAAVAGSTGGKTATMAMFSIAAIVAAAVVATVAIALLVSRRSRKVDAAFVDGRVEHIARDVYGRGSLHV